MFTLILETTLPNTLIGLYNSETAATYHLRDPQPRSSERLHENLHTLLTEAGTDLEGVRRIVVTQGPGSFTGVRVGLAIAQALHLATQADILPLTSLQALALSYPQEGVVTVLIDSLGKEIFAQSFKQGVPLDAPTCLSLDDATAYCADKTTLIGNGAARLGFETSATLILPEPLATADLKPAPATPFYLKPLTYRKMAQNR